MNEIRSNSGSPFDVIVIGSGAGGSAAASHLAAAGLDVLMVEKGGRLPDDGATLDIERVIANGEFKSHEPWVTGSGDSVTPEEYFNVGGKTKWYGAALVRFDPEEFDADSAHDCPPWPIAYGDLEHYYRRAEDVLGLTTFAPEPDLVRILRRIESSGGWRSVPLTMGLRRAILEVPAEARHFDGFASPTGLKADAEGTFLADAAAHPNLHLVTRCAVSHLLATPSDRTRVHGVELVDGRRAFARAVVLSAGALHSPRLLQRFLRSQGLDNLPIARNAGRHLKLHLLTAVMALSHRAQRDLIRKTTLMLNPEVPHSSVQPLGFDAELLANLIPRLVPRPVARVLGAHAYGFFLQTEDGSHFYNRVAEAAHADNPNSALPLIDYDPERLGAAQREHRKLVRLFRRALLKAGYPNFAQPIGVQGTAHACGTLIAGTDPNRCVVNANGGVHGLRGLYVADGSVLPRISRVNPALTIYAWGLRTAELLSASLAREKVQTAPVEEVQLQ